MTRRFTVSADFSGYANGSGSSATFEVTRNTDGEFFAGLISGSTDDGFELDVLEGEAIEEARAWFARKEQAA
ncbi:MAG TPA: hypothetical protein VJN18_35660 [Polyangiaceae bacterium]|nr:hypothetical protein [Polyangiaceae bacterium]